MASAPSPPPRPVITRVGAHFADDDRRALVALLRDAFGDVDPDGAHCGPVPVAERWIARDAAGTVVGQQAVRLVPATRAGAVVAPCRALGDLVVAPDHRGSGLGRRLIEAAVDGLVPDADAPVVTRTEVVAPVFRTLGFRPTGDALVTADGRPFADGWMLPAPDATTAPWTLATPFF